MKQRALLRDYHKAQDGALGERALAVGGNLSTLAVFITLVALGAPLIAKATEFNAAVGKALGGSTTDTAHKKALRKTLIALLDAAADAVENLAQGNEETLTASGFSLSSPGGVSPAPVGTVSIQDFTHPASGKIGLVLNVTGVVRAVVVERQNTDGTFTKTAVFTDLNDAVVANLLPGSSNTFRACAMAAGNQTSEWCMPMTVICT